MMVRFWNFTGYTIVMERFFTIGNIYFHDTRQSISDSTAKVALISFYTALTNFSMDYLVICNFYSDVHVGVINSYYGLSTCTEDDPLATARGLSPRTCE